MDLREIKIEGCQHTECFKCFKSEAGQGPSRSGVEAVLRSTKGQGGPGKGGPWTGGEAVKGAHGGPAAPALGRVF